MKLLFRLLLFVTCLCAVSPLRAQDALQQLAPKVQAALANAACPPTASAASCASFHRLVSSGDRPLLASFTPLFMDSTLFNYIIYVVFDPSMDRFWVIGAQFAQKSSDQSLILHMCEYLDYGDGELAASALSDSDIPGASGPTTFSSPKDGVTVTWTGLSNDMRTSVTSDEIVQGGGGATGSIDIVVDKAIGEPRNGQFHTATLTFKAPGGQFVHSGQAMVFFSLMGEQHHLLTGSSSGSPQ